MQINKGIGGRVEERTENTKHPPLMLHTKFYIAKFPILPPEMECVSSSSNGSIAGCCHLCRIFDFHRWGGGFHKGK